MRILLDSHVFVWAKSAPDNLSDQTRGAIVDPAHDVYVSLATAWELWIKHARKRIKALAPVLDSGAAAFLKTTAESGIELLDITLDHVASAAALPPIHRDPFDRLLIAQAIAERLTLVTNDVVFGGYQGLRLMKA